MPVVGRKRSVSVDSTSAEEEEVAPSPAKKHKVRRAPLDSLDTNRSPKQQQKTSQTPKRNNSIVSQNASQISLVPEISEEGKGSLGTVKSIQLINFMCHSNFKMEFGPQINFVIGQNGSGKSAILTGVVLGLGGRAGNTNRGSSVKYFIKKGTSKAIISLTICNFNGNSRMSYKYDIFGKSIIVERTILEQGGGYAIKDHRGRVVSVKKRDLDIIRSFFSLQIDNPVCILNQEISRNFLNSKNPKDKYNFFMQATRLQNVKEQYTAATIENKMALENFGRKEENIPQLQRELKLVQKKVELLNSCDDLRAQLEKTSKQLVWKIVGEKEFERDEAQMKLADAERKIENGSGRRDEQQAKLDDLKQQKVQLGEKANDIIRRVDEAQNIIVEAKRETESLKSSRRQVGERVRMQESSIASTTREIIEIDHAIRGRRQQNQNLQRLIKEKEQRTVKICQLEEQVKQSDIEVRVKGQELTHLNDQLSAQTNEISRLQGEKKEIQNHLGRAETRIKGLDGSKKNRVALFGQNMPTVLTVIDNECKKGKFLKKPLGPLGHFISLKDETCGFALQACLKKLCYAFACDNAADAKLLREILRKNLNQYEMPQIITRKFTDVPHNVSSNTVRHPEYKSLLDLIVISNPNVFNVIIDRSGLESTAYIPDMSKARDLLINAHTVPENCRQAFTHDGWQIFPAGRNSSYRMYPNDVRDRDIFAKDVEGEIANIRSKMQQMIEKIAEINENGKITAAKRNDLNRQVGSLDSAVKKLRADSSKWKYEVEDLKNVPDPQPFEISSLEDELKTTERKKIAQTEKLEELNTQLKTALDLIKEQEKKVMKLEDGKAKVNAERTNLRKAIQDINEKIQSETDFLAKIDQRIDELKTKVREYVQSTKKLEAEVAQVLITAQEISEERLESRKSSEELKADCKKLKNNLAARESEIGNKDEIVSKFKELSTKFRQVTADASTVKAFINKVEKSIASRKKKYIQQRDFVTAKVAEAFSNSLDMLGFQGRLLVFHNAPNVDGGESKKETLDVFVNPKAKSSEHECVDTRSLSGGERSFSTVAFLLALWEFCHSPVRILDEVDVFMDMVTRRVAMDSLIQAAEKKGTQYIFLSPLPLIESEISDTIRIHHMPNPERTKKGPTETPD